MLSEYTLIHIPKAKTATPKTVLTIEPDWYSWFAIPWRQPFPKVKLKAERRIYRGTLVFDFSLRGQIMSLLTQCRMKRRQGTVIGFWRQKRKQPAHRRFGTQKMNHPMRGEKQMLVKELESRPQLILIPVRTSQPKMEYPITIPRQISNMPMSIFESSFNNIIRNIKQHLSLPPFESFSEDDFNAPSNPCVCSLHKKQLRRAFELMVGVQQVAFLQGLGGKRTLNFHSLGKDLIFLGKGVLLSTR